VTGLRGLGARNVTMFQDDRKSRNRNKFVVLLRGSIPGYEANKSFSEMARMGCIETVK
jgi:hypothetical protein